MMPAKPAFRRTLLYFFHMTYACPMHPEVRSDREGRCPECGMELVPMKERMAAHGGHAPAPHGAADKHQGHSTATFARKFVVCLVLTIPVVLYSGIVPALSGWRPPAFPGSDALPALLASAVFFYGGWTFLAGGFREVRGRRPGMMTLISLAVLAAYGFSLWSTFAGGGETLYWELTTLITIMLLGHWLEMRAVAGTSGALKELAKLLPDEVEVIRGGANAKIPLSELREGDRFIVRPGGKIAADGEIVDGASDVNEAMVTGESRPVRKAAGARVIAGTVNGDGALTVRVDAIGEGTFLSGVMRLVAEAQASKSNLQILSDRAAMILTYVAVAAGLATLAAWLAFSDPAFAVERMVAVLVVACPHALGLAVPLVASISTMMAAKNGFLVKRRLALEAARDVDVVLFDKTGTLTKGEYGVDRVWSAEPGNEDEVLALAAAVDAASEHVVAKAIVAAAARQGIAVPPSAAFGRVPGKGVKGEVGGRTIEVGGLPEAGVPGPMGAEIAAENAKGKTIVQVVRDGALIGAIALSDVIREESREAIGKLKAMGVRVAMVTGDSEDVASWVAKELGIDETFARVMPEEKAGKVKLLQGKGLKVAMVGDGINDAPALTQADLGVAVGAGTNVAIESAGIILFRNDPRDIPKVIRLSRLTYAKMIQNLFWATGYNVVALPLAAGVLAPRGILLEPALAALFMSLSTVIVAANAVLLRGRGLGDRT